MAIQPRHTYPATFANGEPYPKSPPRATEKIIDLAVKTSWPFEMQDETDVEMLVCSGVFPKEHGKNDIDHGAWYECMVHINYTTSHSFSIDSLKALRDKVLDLTGFRLESLSFDGKPNEQYPNSPHVIARLTFADWANLRLDKPWPKPKKEKAKKNGN